MEVGSQITDGQMISHQHANGELFEAQNLEAARGMCPVLGRMSLEEAGLLLELEAMGKEQMAAEQAAPVEKPLIEKNEKLQSPAQRPDRVPATIAIKSEDPVKAEVEPTMHHVPEAAKAAAAPADELTNEAYILEITRLTEPTTDAHKQPSLESSRIEEFARAKDDYYNQTVLALEEAQNRPNVAAPDENINRPLEEAGDTDQHNLPERDLFPGNEEQNIAIYGRPVSEPAEVATSIGDSLPIEIASSEDYIDVSAVDGLNIGEDEAILSERPLIYPSLEEVPLTLQTAESQPLPAIPELPAPVEQIESAVSELTTALDKLEDDESPKLQEILEAVLTLPVKPEAVTDEETVILEQKLGDLFVELFEEVNISYTPELVDSFVELTKTNYLNKLLENMDSEREDSPLPTEIGTREFLQRLLDRPAALKTSITDFYGIGKSTLRLYFYGVDSKSLELA